MMGKIGFSLILALALVTLSTSSERKCVLSGSWRSSVGCKMVVSELSEAGAFSGSYLSVAMAPKADRLPSRLHGIQHSASPTEQPTFGFTVKWQFSESPTDLHERLRGPVLRGRPGRGDPADHVAAAPGGRISQRRLESDQGRHKRFHRSKGQNMGESMRSDGAR